MNDPTVPVLDINPPKTDPKEPVVVAPKSPATSKILWAALGMAVVNGIEQASPQLASSLPSWAMPIFNIGFPILIAAFRQWSTGAPIRFGGEYRFGR